MGLVIKASPGDRIRVGDVEVCVVYARRGQAKLVFTGDRDVPVHRVFSSTPHPHPPKDGTDG